MTIIVRGTYVTVTAQFYDEDDVVTVPTNPVLHYSYEQAEEVVNDSVDMELTDDTASTSWFGVIDTGPADDGVVFYTIRADGVAKDGNFRLVANPANPQDGT